MKLGQRIVATPKIAVIKKRTAQMETVFSQEATFTQITIPQTGRLISKITILSTFFYIFLLFFHSEFYAFFIVNCSGKQLY